MVRIYFDKLQTFEKFFVVYPTVMTARGVGVPALTNAGGVLLRGAPQAITEGL